MAVRRSFRCGTRHFLVIVAQDLGAPPRYPRAYLTNGAQGINFHRNIWHGVLIPLSQPALFAVIDRIGATPDLEEHWFPPPWEVRGPA